MTRKRFVKLMMAEGYSRNSANALAWQVAKKGISYQKGYQAATAWSRLTKKLKEALVPVTEAARKMSQAFAEVLRAAQPAYTLGKALEAYKAGMDAYNERHGVKPQE